MPTEDEEMLMIELTAKIASLPDQAAVVTELKAFFQFRGPAGHRLWRRVKDKLMKRGCIREFAGVLTVMCCRSWCIGTDTCSVHSVLHSDGSFFNCLCILSTVWLHCWYHCILHHKVEYHAHMEPSFCRLQSPLTGLVCPYICCALQRNGRSIVFPVVQLLKRFAPDGSNCEALTWPELPPFQQVLPSSVMCAFGGCQITCNLPFA